jgi:hypothetical protein
VLHEVGIAGSLDETMTDRLEDLTAGKIPSSLFGDTRVAEPGVVAASSPYLRTSPVNRLTVAL